MLLLAAGCKTTGLTPVYPKEASCLKIDSYWGSTKNVDGGNRVPGAIHNGIDIKANYGTPVRAVASGLVYSISELRPGDGWMIKIYHSFVDTGLPYPVQALYGHLKPEFTVSRDDKVQIGQIIGFVGRKANVSEHLHLGIRRLDSSQLVDPLLIFTGKLAPPKQPTAKAQISYVDMHDQIHPKGIKIVWPFACKKM